MVRMEWQRASFLWKASGKPGNTSLPLSHKSTKVSTSLDEDLLMFVALPFLIFYASFSLLLGIYDARTGLLPDRFTCPLLWGGLLYHQICLPERLPDALWGAIAGYGGFALIYWGYRLRYQKEGLGYGDVKYLAALGAWHCWETLPLLVFLAAMLACGRFGVALLVRGKSALINPLPFGPWLAVAGFITGWKVFFPDG
ncbi:Leader peptidase (Prepilin peptidase) [Salmonella enterica subsp. enterica serovar Heidelberg str. B182]|nr:Leader peptidase (Prepilin peptidase) [Salmonella enterica subsp. enterica serovar Heidelberg str. B182]AHB95276.1 leader peptidase hopD [Salmonella enterica subsp. enterica serovar Heidelberg str. CFSAN002064]